MSKEIKSSVTWDWMESVLPKVNRLKDKGSDSIKRDKDNVAAHTTLKGRGKIARLRKPNVKSK